MGQVVSATDLAQTLFDLKQQGKRVVTTNGCFDVLHVGHLRYLQAARQVGDLLVVLLNSDLSTQLLKGPKRPIVPEAERAELLAGMSCVDFVTLFDETSPEKLLEQLQPSIHVKGGDYTEETLPEAPLLKRIGTQMVFIPFIQGKSTTNVIQKIVDLYSCNPSMP